MIGGVGQRMLAGVTKKMAGQFFTAVDEDIAGVRKAEAGRSRSPRGALASRPCPALLPRPRCMPVRRLPPPGALVLDKRFAAGVGLRCGAIALAGVIVGWAILEDVADARIHRRCRPARAGRRDRCPRRSVRKNLDKCVDFTRRCVDATGAELVVLPESATTGFTPDCSDRGAVGPRLRDPRPGHRAGPAGRPRPRRVCRAGHLRARPRARRRLQLLGADRPRRRGARRLPQDPPVLHRARRRRRLGDPRRHRDGRATPTSAGSA